MRGFVHGAMVAWAAVFCCLLVVSPGWAGLLWLGSFLLGGLCAVVYGVSVRLRLWCLRWRAARHRPDLFPYGVGTAGESRFNRVRLPE